MNKFSLFYPFQLKRYQGLSMFVGLPLLFALLYFLFIAANIYEEDCQFIVKQNQNEPASLSFDLSLLTASNTTSREDAFLIKEFIYSTNLLEILEQEMNLREHYVSPRLDFIRKLSHRSTKEEFLEYYRDMVAVEIDPESTIVTVRARAFDPETTNQLLGLILQNSETFINQISQKLAEEQVNFVRQEVSGAEERLRATKESMLKFQNRKTLLDPESSIESMLTIIAGLETEIAEKKAALKGMRGFLQEKAFQVTNMEIQIKALEEQIEEEKRRLTGSPSVSLNQIMAEFHNHTLDLEFALDAYRSAYTSLEKARMEASRKLKHMVVIARSGLPEEPTYPRRLYNVFTVLIVLLLTYGIGKLIIATINDHQI